MQKGFAPILVLVGILVIVGIAGGAYYFGKFQASKPQPSSPVVASPTPQLKPSSDETANWKTYRNQNKGFLIEYPNEWQLSEEIITADFSTSPYTSLTKGELDVQAAVNIFVEKKTDPESFLPPETFKEARITESIFNKNQVKIVAYQGLNLQKWIFIDQDERTYILNIWGEQEDQETFDQILATFKFVNPDSNKLKVCPDRWFEFFSPIKVKTNPYFGQKGQFMLINDFKDLVPAEEFDLEWIKENCQIKKPDPVG